MNKTFIKHSFIFFIFIAVIFSCNKGGSNDSKEPPEQPIAMVPGKPEAILPKNAETCSDFKEVQGETDKAIILFSWSTAANATSYIVEVFESDITVSNATVTTTTTELTLEKGKSYSWRITAKNTDGETQSNTFSFITPGEPLGNFAPYAAEISMDYNTNNGELIISWVGDDEDGDSLTYDVIVKEDDLTIAELNDLAAVELDPISYVAGTLYFVQVTSKDSFGNFSVSTNTLKIED